MLGSGWFDPGLISPVFVELGSVVNQTYGETKGCGETLCRLPVMLNPDIFLES